jgi:anti-anti-sigma factor
MEATMTTDSNTIAGPAVLRLPARLDADTVARLRPELDAIAANANDAVVVDLEQVAELDAAGLGAIVFLHKRLLARGHNLVLTSVSGEPAELLRALRVNRVIPIIEKPSSGCAA